MPLHTRRWILPAVLPLLVSPSCDSPAEPGLDGDRVPIGQIIEETFAADSVRHFSFVSTAGVYAVFLASLQSTVELFVVDSANQQVVGLVRAGIGSLPFDENATLNFAAPAGRIFHLTARAIPSGSGGLFRFLVYRAHLAPEHATARFVFGDTVSGEVLDGIADIDDFVVAGQTGQEFVATAEAFGPVGSGMLGLLVYDSVGTNPFLGDVLASAGLSATATTGRQRIPASRDYRFRFLGVSGPFPRYHGPYRFWSYLISRAPEHGPATVAIGDLVTGEAIDRAGDIDEFTWSAAAGSEFNVFLQSGRAFQLYVESGPVPAFTATTAVPGDTGLLQHATGRFQLPSAGPHRIRVTGVSEAPVADTGAYRVYLYPINRQPEHVPAAVTPGDTVSGEAIDVPGDVDEFTFAGSAGDEFNVLFQVANGSAPSVLRVEALDAAGAVMRLVDGSGTDTSLYQHVTGRFALSADGTGRLRVRGGLDNTDRDIGPYRLVVHKVNRQPESLPATLTFGDSLSGEAIEIPGDIDEFRVVVPDSSGSSLVLRLGPDATEGLRVQLLDSTTDTIRLEVASTGPGVYGVTDRVLLAPGTYTLRVHGSSWENEQSLLRGSYDVWLYRFRFGTENVLDTIAIGDTVSDESIGVVADFDRFWFHGLQGQRINIAFQGTAPTVTGGFQALLYAPYPLIGLITPTRADSLGASQTDRIDLPYTGWYNLDVMGQGIGDRGTYRLAITERPMAPEQTSGILSPGDSVVNETLDPAGDVDEFILVAPPGQTIALVANQPVGLPHILAYDSLTRDTLAWVVLQGFDKLRRFTMPASGRTPIAVFEYDPFGLPFCGDPTCFGRYSYVGGYRFSVHSYNPAPERAAATFAIGDSVAEVLTPGTDLDLFTGTGDAGTRVQATFQLDQVPVPAGSLVWFDIFDSATGALLSGRFGLFGTGPVQIAPFRIPSSGTFQVRVYGRDLDDTVASAPYRFVFQPAP